MAYSDSSYNIARSFNRIENELIESMMRNMKKHRVDEIDEGLEWVQWQALQLQALEEYKRTNPKKFAKEYKRLNAKIEKAIAKAGEDGAFDEEKNILKNLKNARPVSNGVGVKTAFFTTNKSKMDALIKATTNDIVQAEYSVLRRSNDAYRQIIFDAQVYANSGAGTYEQAVDMATKDFLKSGINAIQYKNGSRHTIEEYSRMAIRTASKRAYLIGQAEMRNRFGIHTVIVNKRTNPCPKCLEWVGKILIDDVYGQGTPADGDYPMLSEAMASGFLHPNCKDGYTTYFPEGKQEENTLTKEEVEQAEEDYTKEQEKQKAENTASKYGRLAKNSLDEANKERYKALNEKWHAQAETKSNELTNRRKARMEEARKRASKGKTETKPKHTTDNITDFNSMDRDNLLAWADKNLQTKLEGTKGANTDFIRETIKVLEQFEQKMGGTIDGLSIKFGGTPAGAYAHYDDATKTLLLKKTGSIDAIEQKMREENARYHVKWKTELDYYATDTYSGTIWHELGHAIDIDTNQNLSRTLGNDVELFGKSTKVSAYSRSQQNVRVTKASESFAENFSAYMEGGKNAGKVPTEIKEMIDNYFDSKKGTTAIVKEVVEEVVQKPKLVYTDVDNVMDAINYAENTFGVTTIGLEEFNVNALNMVNSVITDVYNTFGNLHDKGTLEFLMNWKKRSSFYMAYSSSSKAIALRKLKSKTALKTLEKDAKEQFDIGYWSTPAKEHAIRHELGHAIQHSLDSGTMNRCSILFKECRNKANVTNWKTDARYGSQKVKEAGELLSYYGLQNEKEFIAECVAEYLAGNPRETARECVETILGISKRWE